MTDENTEGIKQSASQETPNLDNAHLVYSSEDGEHNHPHELAASPVEPLVTDTILHPDIEAELAVYDPTQFVEVEFKGSRRCYFVNAGNLPIEQTQFIIVEAEKGIDLGQVITVGETAYLKMGLRMKPCSDTLKKVVRIAEDNDMKVLHYHREQENTTFEICKQKIEKHQLEMKLIDVEYQFDRNRITFYFTADGRIDFRELVKDLAAEYRTRIELRQIGVRDQAKRIGGIGNCGRDLCCAAWIDSFEHISTEMARVQNLPLNPFKLAGQCGRLKCCLAYESEIYEERLKYFPPLESIIKTTHGNGKVEKIDVFHDAVYLHFEKDNSWERLTLNEVNEFLHDA